MTIYFVQCGLNGPIKIGIAADPKHRLNSLQTGSPEPLHILGTMRGGGAEEKQLHAQFQALRLRGEWFTPDVELLKFIDQAAEQDKDEWLALVRIEPRLLDLLNQAQVVHDDYSKPYFCAHDHWYGEDNLKEKLSSLVGWSAHDGARRLRTMEAYDLVYDKLYDCLPNCRDCACL